jgi:hypothetical protein
MMPQMMPGMMGGMMPMGYGFRPPQDKFRVSKKLNKGIAQWRKI